MASLFHWLLCCLCISNILLIISNMVESLGALEVLAIIMMTMIMIMIYNEAAAAAGVDGNDDGVNDDDNSRLRCQAT